MTGLKILVISDSHGNIKNLKHVMGFAGKIHAHGVVHCGDWDNVLTVETVLDSKIPLYSVLGNADVDPEVEKSLSKQSKKFDPYFLEFELDGRKIGVIHNIRHLISSIQHLDILFCGHTHQKTDEMVQGVRVVNPGALVKEDFSFGLYDTTSNEVEFVGI